MRRLREWWESAPPWQRWLPFLILIALICEWAIAGGDIACGAVICSQ